MWRLLVCIVVSSLISLYLLPGSSEEFRFWGQNPDLVSVIKGRALTDSRETDGGVKIFTMKLLFTENQNRIGTDAHGSLSIASNVNIYRGELISIRKKNLLRRRRDIVFLNEREIEVTGWENNPMGWMLGRRSGFLKILTGRRELMFNEASSFFNALFLGIQENPRGEIYIDLRRSGASHILALSGLHLGIVALGVMVVFKLFFGRKISFLLTLIVVLAYIFLVGFSPSLTRALLLFGFTGFAGILGIRKDLFHILVLCFLFQIVLFPKSAYSLSFQLSYLALGGIIIGSPGISRILPGILPPVIRIVLSASAAAQFSTASLVLYSFGVIYPVGIISGVVFIPLITLFIWFGIFGLLPLPYPIGELVFWLMIKIYSLIKISAGFFSSFPEISYRGAAVGLIFFLLFMIYKILKNMRDKRSGGTLF